MEPEHLIALGEMRATVATLQADVTDIRKDQKSQNEKLDKLLAVHNQRKGATAFGKVILGIASSGGLLGWAWEHFFRSHP